MAEPRILNGLSSFAPMALQAPYIATPSQRLQHLESLGGIANTAKLLLLAVWDLFLNLLGLPGPTIPLAGPPGSLSIFHLSPSDLYAQQQSWAALQRQVGVMSGGQLWEGMRAL